MENVLKTIWKMVLFFVVIIMINGIGTSGIATKEIVAGANGTNHSVVVGFKHPVGPADDVVIHAHGGEAKKHFHLIPVIAASVPESKIAEMKNDSRIAYVEEDKTYEAADVYSDEYNNSWGVGHIGSQFVHNQGITGKGVKVAVIDTGIDCTHPDLKDNCYSGYDYVSNDTNTFDDSYNSHGTHVSGIIAAEKNGFGIVGVAPNASVYAVKVLGGSGFGVESWIISGIQWAVDNNMTIISMSIQGPDSQGIHDAVDAAYNTGLLLVAAAGNTNGGSVSYPAGYNSVIAVTATDVNDHNASFAPNDSKIELAAPGVNINSTIVGGYGILNGTSMSAPYVTGVAALLYSTNLKALNKDVRQIMDNTAFDLGIPGRDSIYGYGIVDAQNATLGIPTFHNFVQKLVLIRTKNPPINDSKTVNLSQGNYSIIINNTNLSELAMMVYNNGKIRKDLSKKFVFNTWSDPNFPSSNNWAETNFVFDSSNTIGYDKSKNSNNISIDMVVQQLFKVVFVPYGKNGTMCNVTIKKI